MLLFSPAEAVMVRALPAPSLPDVFQHCFLIIIPTSLPEADAKLTEV